MPRLKKPKLHVVPDSAPEFTLRGRTFTVKSLDRGTEDGYDDGAEFLILVAPIVTKLFSSMTNAGVVVQNRDFGAMGGLEQAAFLLDMVEDFGVLSMLGELTSLLPRLVAIICRGEDPEVTELDVKAWAGVPWNKELIKAVLLQISVDKIIQNLVETGATFLGGFNADTEGSKGASQEARAGGSAERTFPAVVPAQPAG